MDKKGPKSFGNYAVEKLLSENDLGHLYLARHQDMAIPVVVKVLDKLTLTKNQQKKLAKSAQFLITTIHPAINRVYDFWITDNIVHIVSAYQKQGNLRDAYPKGYRLSEKQVAELMKHLASGLLKAHGAGVFHGDLRFENILMDENNQPLWSDLGIFPVITRQEETGLYKAEYMAPEQFAGVPTMATDLYGLGVIAYELLAGLPPFDGNYEELEQLHTANIPPLVNRKGVLISQQISDAVLKALAKKPEDRQVSVAVFANDLTQYAHTSDEFLDEDDTIPARFPQGATVMIHSEHTGKIVDFSWSPDGIHIASLHEQHRSSSPDINKTLHIWSAQTGIFEHELEEGIYPKAVGWSSGGNNVVSTGWSKFISVWDASTGKRLHKIQPPTDVYIDYMKVSPDGKTAALLLKDDKKVYFFDVETAKTTSFHRIDTVQLSWSPDSTKIALVGKDNIVQIWDATNKHRLLFFLEHTKNVFDLAWSLDGKMIASTEYDTLFVWSTKTGRIFRSKEFDKHTARLAWFPDGTRLAFITYEGEHPNFTSRVKIWNLVTDEVEYVYKRHSTNICKIAVSPDGTRIASGDENGRIFVWQAV